MVWAAGEARRVGRGAERQAQSGTQARLGLW